MPLSSRLMRDLVDYADALCDLSQFCLLLACLVSQQQVHSSFGSVAFRTVQISRLPFIFLLSLLLLFSLPLLVSPPSTAFVCKSVKFFFLYFACFMEIAYAEEFVGTSAIRTIHAIHTIQEHVLRARSE